MGVEAEEQDLVAGQRRHRCAVGTEPPGLVAELTQRRYGGGQVTPGHQ